MTLEQLEVFEEWRPVIGYEGLYEVSNWGRIRSLARTIPHKHPGHTSIVPGRLRVLVLKKEGYFGLTLTDRNGRKVNGLVHQLVAAAWIGPKPPGFQVDHIDGDKRNNMSRNLRYLTPKEQMDAGNFERRVAHGATHYYAKLSSTDVVEIRRLCLEGMTQTEVAKMFNVRQQTISKIVRNKARRHA
jgi:hypothetical protein